MEVVGVLAPAGYLSVVCLLGGGASRIHPVNPMRP
jgi:hypothetical protein